MFPRSRQPRISFTRGSSRCLYFIFPFENHELSTDLLLFSSFSLFAMSSAMSSTITKPLPFSIFRFKRIFILLLCDRSLTMTGLGLPSRLDPCSPDPPLLLAPILWMISISSFEIFFLEIILHELYKFVFQVLSLVLCQTWVKLWGAFICSIRVWRKARRRIYLGRISGYAYRVCDLSMTKRGELIVLGVIVFFVRPWLISPRERLVNELLYFLQKQPHLCWMCIFLLHGASWEKKATKLEWMESEANMPWQVILGNTMAIFGRRCMWVCNYTVEMYGHECD